MLDASTPDVPLALSKSLWGQKRLEEARAVLSSTVAQFPSSGVAWFTLGCLLIELKRLLEAAEALHRSVLLEPAVPRLHELSKVLLDLGHEADAEAMAREACRLDASDGKAAGWLGKVLLKRKQASQSKDAYDKAMRLAPNLTANQHGMAILISRYFGQVEDAVALLRKSLEKPPQDAFHNSDLLLTMHYRDCYSQSDLFAEHLNWDAKHGQFPWKEHTARAGIGGKIRVGYVSRDFRRHSVAFYWEAIGKHHDRAAYEVFCYADVRQPDDNTRRLSALADHWKPIQDMSDEQVAALVYSDQIDILVDLGGHAGGKLEVFARKPAPIQTTYMGYPNTTGLRAMDYRLVDAVTDPAGHADLYHTEKLVRLPGCFLCYSPLEESPPIEKVPCLKNGFVTFANFNMAAKMDDAWIARVATLLHSVAGSRLMLKSETFIGHDDASSSWVFDRFAAHGIGRDRLSALAKTDSQKEHLALYGQADIALDTFPYNGTTTTCEALWMGVPVVTLAGNTHVSRVGLSLLTAVGLPELAASTPEMFIQIAAKLAEQPELLGQWRRTMRERMKPLMDGAAFTRKLEHAYQEMVENHMKN